MNGSRISFAIAVLALGAALGLGSYTFAYTRGWAYLTDDPRACANCHVMNEQYDGWIKSSHRSVAVCNDCHVPHSVFAKYRDEGPQRLLALVLLHDRQFPEPIRALPASRAIAEANCRRCHEPVVEAMGTPAHAGSRDISCIRCHGSVGHMELLVDQRGRFLEVNRVRPETPRHARLEPQCGPDRGDRDGSRHRGDRGAPRQHHGAEGGSAEPILPRRGVD